MPEKSIDFSMYVKSCLEYISVFIVCGITFVTAQSIFKCKGHLEVRQIIFCLQEINMNNI